MTFSKWYQEVCNELTKSGEILDLEKRFASQHDDFMRVKLLLTKEVFLRVDIRESFHSKDSKQSDSLRSIGNKLYVSSSFDNALKAYTKAISLAEQNSKPLSLAYANRSAVLFEMKNYKLCETDILLAFMNNYPNELQFKLHERLGKCYIAMNRHLEAVKCFEKCLEAVKESKLNQVQIKEKCNVINSLIDGCVGENEPNHLSKLFNSMYISSAPDLHTRNNVYLSASGSFSMVRDEDHGRYAVAKQDIKAGEIILVEEPFACLCLPERYSTHCYECLTRLKISYPCRSCSSIAYCSMECERKSWESFHCYECRYLNLLTLDDIGLGHLAMKVVLKNKFEELKNFNEIYQENKNEFGLDKEGNFDPRSYFCLFSLVGNSECRKLSDLFKRSIMSIFLAKVLQVTGYVPINDEKALDIVAGHLLKQIQMLPCNAHEVSEAQLTGNNLALNELKEIGSAAYPSLSLLNHSCDPSVVRHCYGSTCVVRALKHIKKGEEIVDNYGFLYAVESKAERVQHLQEQYLFKCQCTPCQQDWPLYSELPDDLPTFVCSSCGNDICAKSYKCLKCNKEDSEVLSYYRNELHKNFQDAMKTVLDGNGEDIHKELEVLLCYLDLLTRRAKLPTIHVNNCQEVVKLCFSLSANFARI